VRRVAVLALVFLSLVINAPRGAAPAAESPRRVTIAAAADLRFALEEIGAGFGRRNPGLRLEPTYGASGNFFAQLANRAPFDVFLSADEDYPRRLAEAGHVLEGRVFRYAVGHVVLWVPRSTGLDVGRLGIELLKLPAVRHVAIANPEHAPYGRAAEAALRTLGVYDAVKPKLVLGENVAQAAQFAQTGAAEAALIARSLAEAPEMQRDGAFWAVPTTAYPRMDQAGVVLEWAQDLAAARAFRDFLLGETAQTILARYGLGDTKE
jgi:molybdate transport system substrate-binding protein